MEPIKNKVSELRLGGLIDSEDLGARFGGKSFLSSAIEWPKNIEGEKLVLLFSLPISFVQGMINNPGEELYISVFTFYNDGYFLDEIIDNGEEESDVVRCSSTRVLIHTKADLCRSEADIELKAYEWLEDNSSSDVNFETEDVWRLGGEPIYLQNASSVTNDMVFVFQFYTGYLPDEYQNILYLSDAIGYLFLEKDLSGGYFFGQCT